MSQLKKCVGTGCPPDYKLNCYLLFDPRWEHPFHTFEPKAVGEHCPHYATWPKEDMWVPDRMGALE